ncbi:MAG TPA: glycosyltransferase [Candidatus Acidoferrales bacterium]|nr:glycosyltransferase [Candidatus Acidoferrales bacterium]
MRVLHVTPYFAPAFGYGGPPRSVLGLCRALQQTGVAVRVFTTTANGADELPSSTAEADQYDGVPVRYFPRAFPRRFFGAAGLRAALDAATRDYDLLHIHGLWNLPAWIAARYARSVGMPYVLSPRGMLQPGALALRRVRKQIAYPTVERRNLTGAALLHATSAAEAQALAQQQFGVKIVTVPNGVELPPDEQPARGSFRQKLGLTQPSDAPLIVFLGRVHPIKRLDLLAAAFDRVRVVGPRAHLAIAGPSEAAYRRSIEPLFSDARDHVHWIGEVDEAQKWSLLGDADVLVLCSASENFGMSVAEAMAAGVPVVVTRTCPWEDVERHACGVWVASDPDAIARGIVTIIDNPSWAKEMGARGRALIRDRYSWTAVAHAMADCYAGVARRRIASAATP